MCFDVFRRLWRVVVVTLLTECAVWSVILLSCRLVSTLEAVCFTEGASHDTASDYGERRVEYAKNTVG